MSLSNLRACLRWRAQRANNDKLETEKQRQIPTIATLTNLSVCDEEFVQYIKCDIERYLKKRRRNCVLLLPPVNNYRRYLIHQTCESFRQQYDLFTFSIGQGPFRRTVICFKNQLLDPLKYTAAVSVSNENRRHSQVKSWRSERKPEQLNSAASSLVSNSKRDLNFPTKMGVEKNDASNAVSTRCSKTAPVNIYRPPALRCQSNESTDSNVAKNNKKIESNSKITACSISCNNSPIHANENQMCNTLTSQPDDVSVLAHAPTNDELSNTHDEHSEQQHKPSTVTAASRRERRPDRAVYIPRARRSQTTPPTAAQQATSANNNVNEQQLPITVDANGLVSTPPSTKTDELSKNLSTIKKSKSSSANKERKERSKKQTTKNLASLEMPGKNENTSEVDQETKEKNCDNNKHRLKPENNRTKNISSTNTKNLRSPALVEKATFSDTNVVVGKKSKPKMAESGGNGYPNVHIEDVMAADRIPPKCDIEEQELQRASKEINRSNRRIMKQTFVSDVLEIPEKIDDVDNKKISATIIDQSPNNSRANIDTTTDEEEDDDEDDWENMYDENGECLDPKILQELTASVGKVKIELPKMDYSAYLTKQSLLNEEEFPHVLEVSNFPVEFKNHDLLMLFSQYKESGFDIKWVDDTHALAIFSSSRIAAEVLTMGHPFVMLKPLAEATMESRLKAKKCAASLQPYRPRPETCAALARRLVTGALGVRLKTAAAERENEKRVLREAKERKLLAAKQRDEIWES